MGTHRLSHQQLAQDHFGGACLGDKRRSARLVTVAGQILAQPRGSLAAKITDPSQLDAAYNLFRNPDATAAAIQAPHRRCVRDQLNQRDDVTLIAHDGTELNYSGLDVPELGVLGGPKQRGFIAHNSLALTPTGHILGLLHQIVIAPQKGRRKARKATRREDPNKASVVWRDAMAAIGPPPPGKRWVHLADRGADVTEFLDFADEHGLEFVVRVHHDRNVRVHPGADEEAAGKLLGALRGQPEQARRAQRVRAQAGSGERSATVAISAVAVSLIPPRQPRGRERGVPLRVLAIRVWEVEPPEGEEPLEWVLVTNVPGDDVGSLWERVDWYAKRWTIEEYHKALKTGVNVETLQLTTAVGLRNAVAVLSVVAVVLVMVREMARVPTTADEPIAGWVPPAWIDVLSQWRHGEVGRLKTVKEWVWALARLGGHQNAKKLGPPGWLTLLRGWVQLQAMIEGWELRTKCGGS